MVGGEKSWAEKGEARVFISRNAKSGKDSVGEDFAFQEHGEEDVHQAHRAGGRQTPGRVTWTRAADCSRTAAVAAQLSSSRLTEPKFPAAVETLPHFNPPTHHQKASSVRLQLSSFRYIWCFLCFKLPTLVLFNCFGALQTSSVSISADISVLLT